ncbi:MAG: chitinase [Oleispira sp.]|jgi:chitinase
MIDKQWPKTAMVGYIDCSAIGMVDSVQAEQVQAYNVVIFGFANPDGTIPSSGLFQGLTKTVQKIKDMESPGTVNLLSVGGEGGAVKISADEVEVTVNNLMTSIATLELDGIDLDIESSETQIDDIFTFAKLLRSSLDVVNGFLSCAPVLAGSNDVPTLNTPGGSSWAEVYGPEGVVFDAINVQAYNSGSSFLFADPGNNDQLVSEASPDIVRAAYSALQQRGNINVNSRIVIGVPCNINAANPQSNCWSDDSSQAEIAQSLIDNVVQIQQGHYDMDPSVFGGLMSWSITNDAYDSTPTGFFSNNVAAKITMPADAKLTTG